MRPSEALHLYRSRSREIARSHHVSDVRVFGSALRGEYDARSALDLLAEPTALATLMDIGAIRFKLKNLLGMRLMCAPQMDCRQGFALREAMVIWGILSRLLTRFKPTR